MITDELSRSIRAFCSRQKIKLPDLAETDPAILAAKGHQVFHALNKSAGREERGFFVGVAKDKLAFNRFLHGLGAPVPELCGLVRSGFLLDSRVQQPSPIDTALHALSGDMFAKPRRGKGGAGSFLFSVEQSTMNRRPVQISEIAEALSALDEDGVVIERAVVQHPALSKIHPNSVNTVRLITSTLAGCAGAVTAALRFGAGGSVVDNASQGGLHAGIDLADSCLRGPAMRPGGRRRLDRHPTTGVEIDGYCIPFLHDARLLCERIHDIVELPPTLAWDIAITPSGPLLIEVNTRWDASLHRTADPEFILRLFRQLVP